MSIDQFKDRIVGLSYQLERISSYLDEFYEKSKGKSPSCFVQGIMLTGPSGAGKTMLLKALATEWNIPAYYLDFKSRSHASGSGLEESIFSVLKQRDAKLYLLDNIHLLMNMSALSELIECIDILLKDNCFIIGVCENTNQLDASLIVPYRLGEIIYLNYPSYLSRYEYIVKLLDSFNVIRFDKSVNKHTAVQMEDVVLEVSQRTQGCSICSINNIISDALLRSRLCAPELQCTDIIIHILLDCVYRAQSTVVEDPFLSSLLIDIKDPPDLVGVGNLVDDVLLSLGVQQRSDFRVTGITKGVVIHGPSGSGKTSVALAIAHRCRGSHRVMRVSCAELIHKIVGESEQKLVSIFEAARLIAPTILILDNLDTIVGVNSASSEYRDDAGYSSRRTSHRAIDRLLSTLLVELDGGLSARSGIHVRPVLVVATATHIGDLDKSLLRPGRLSEHIELKHPQYEERYELFRHLLSKVPVEEGLQMDHLISKLATASHDKSNAEIKHIILEACMASVRKAIMSTSQDVNSSAGDISKSCVLTQQCFSS